MKIKSIYSSQPQWFHNFYHASFQNSNISNSNCFWHPQGIVQVASVHFLDMIQVSSRYFHWKTLKSRKQKNGLSLPRAASLRLTSTVTATESPTDPSRVLLRFPHHFFLSITVCFIFRRGCFHGRDNCHKILVSFTSTLASCLFSLCIFPWVDCEQAGDWLGQIMDLKRTREETSPGTWGGRESLHFKSTIC